MASLKAPGERGCSLVQFTNLINMRSVKMKRLSAKAEVEEGQGDKEVARRGWTPTLL